ncbi:hypothetical protein AC579_5366 [Pseudocercospora musae]|uniref:Uncharacterized protein n=1 Tax=Pseudocercospora musae TaxID=113226 RepID=A0A139IT57_9PEZI|nr:hypothetical protein AC579_5366 [Pseudocercospora musae]
MRLSANPFPSIKHLRHKIDLYIIPFLALCYALNFLDKVLSNYNQVMNLSRSLNLRENRFPNAVSAFFIADLIAVIPNI